MAHTVIKNNKVVNVVQEDDEILTKDSTVQRGEVLEDAQIKEKKATFVSKNTIKYLKILLKQKILISLLDM